MIVIGWKNIFFLSPINLFENLPLRKIFKIMENLTLETLPRAFTELQNEVREIKQLLTTGNQNAEPLQSTWLSIDELCEYLPDKPAKQTIYGYVSGNKIPFYKTGKKLRFLKAEIDNWLLVDRKLTANEIATQINSPRSFSKERRNL